MSREALQESLSAVMDNEADELELRRVLSAVDDAETRATWSRYQVARAAMHKELLLPNLDIASAVSAALAAGQGQQGPMAQRRSPGGRRLGHRCGAGRRADVQPGRDHRRRAGFAAACTTGPEHATNSGSGSIGRL